MNSETTEWAPQPVIDWLLRDGRLLPDCDTLAQQLGARLVAAGAPLARLRLSFRTVHPLMAGVSTNWERDAGLTQQANTPYGFEANDTYIGSPIAIIVETRQPFRRRLDRDLGPSDHRLLHELKARGMTDYYGLHMKFATGPGAILVLCTDRAGGFSDRDITGLTRVADALSAIVETLNARLIALAVAEAYLGPRTGRRVLEGQITRGHVEMIKAAILVSDIRGWTQLNTQLTSREAVDHANRYFEVLSDTIDRHGGEILKFLGDGLLAIFPADPDADDACARAVAAAREACSPAHDPGVAFGIGLHFGEVLYGNVGSRSRIDFTVLGQAVNIAARIEGLCNSLGHPILCSGEIANRLDTPVTKVSDETLKGLDGTVPIYGVEPDVHHT